ncbi:cytochrome b/b6 domain-containing protein [Rhodoferax sp. U11-2br]|uniref:cytochrome b/b6 domain-containing protein n=1 Tax=Rhodoferax sp. U11-2br TaxID=2838878 RepID=UPI001BE8DA1C|nr:cytochrome b/b6 domain-containing protein [Rhodoferax sp. U11-2br]MBT3067715.1 cytochrome b/b6 domain-containing protein [Rhodoferax sp. U11-2br]
MSKKFVVRVWDAPTRLFHWTLTVCVVAAVITAQIGGAAMDWHFRLGYAILTLLMFRLIWGLVGGRWSRFSAFLYRPGQVLAHLKGQTDPQHAVGHNPLGALSVFALMGFLTIQLVSGMFSDDEISATGPLASLASSTWVSNATYYHAEVGKLILIVLVTLHVIAIALYFLKKRENLVRPMVTGDKTLEYAAPASEDHAQSRIKAALIVTVCALVVWAFVRWMG